tara:strand:+ start:5195 stop:7567 length:2373 start_codon:yes stop_codon:yes gene_type:complete
MATKKTTLINPAVLEDTANPSAGPVDTFRREFGFWSPTDQGIKYTNTEDDAEVILGSITAPEVDLYPISTPGDFTLIDFESRKQTITIIGREDPSTTTHDSWIEKVNNLIPSGEFEYFVTSFENPITIEESLNVDGDVLGATAGIKYVYNYYDSGYERVLDTVNDHVIIPSLYSMFDQSSIVGTDKKRDDIADVDILPSSRGTGTANLGRILKRNKRRATPRQKFQNQIVPLENMPLLADYEGSKYLFPMYIDINVPLGEKNELAQLVRDSSVGIALTRDIEGAPDEASSLKTETVSFSTSIIEPTLGTEQVENSRISVKVLDLNAWYQNDAPAYAPDPLSEPSYPMPNNFYFIGEESGHFQSLEGFEETDSITTGVGENEAFGVGLSLFFDGFNTLAEDKRKTIKPILNGAESYSEMLMYKIEKRLGPMGEALPDPIQTFHFMNSAEVEEWLSNEREFKFVDTQVKYGQEYSYIVTAYRAVIGEKYTYQNIKTFAPDPYTAVDSVGQYSATVDVYMHPTIKLIEVPLFGSIGTILDHPPLQPEVRFFPLVDDRNKIKVFFTTSTGQEDVEPISLSDEERAIADQIAINQGRNDGKITFKSDDSATAFEIFRLDSPPAVIEDFSNNLYATAITMVGAERIQGSSATSELSQIPNQKYYYMFRTIDIHGNTSNPSPIYEIELYNDGGAGYPIIRHYDLASPDPKITTKSARKMIQIIPRISQVFLNELASGLISEDNILQPAVGKTMVLGNQDESLFGKKFKIRLTSKSTGKKIDLNIDFKTKRITGEIES